MAARYVFVRLLVALTGVLLSVPPAMTAGTGVHRPRISHPSVLLQTRQDLPVRVMDLPPPHDVKGQPQKYTAEERRKLRGPDPKLPGYTSSWDRLTTGQVLTVYLAKRKPARGSDGSLSASKWVPVGTVTGTLTRVKDSDRTITLRVEALGPHLSGATTPKEPIADVQVTMIVIMSGSMAGHQKARPARNAS